MKMKKAVKSLKKAQSFVSKVVEQYAGAESPIRDLLDTAEAHLRRAQGLIQGNEAARSASKAGDRPAKKLPAPSQPGKRGLSAAARKKLSVAAKKRWAAAKKRGAKSLAG
jgi:hypothetical protein